MFQKERGRKKRYRSGNLMGHYVAGESGWKGIEAKNIQPLIKDTIKRTYWIWYRVGSRDDLEL